MVLGERERKGGRRRSCGNACNENVWQRKSGHKLHDNCVKVMMKQIKSWPTLHPIQCGIQNSPAPMPVQQTPPDEQNYLAQRENCKLSRVNSIDFFLSRHFNQFEREILPRSSGNLLSEAAGSSLEPFPSLMPCFKISHCFHSTIFIVESPGPDTWPEGRWQVPRDVPMTWLSLKFTQLQKAGATHAWLPCHRITTKEWGGEMYP